MRHVIIIHLTFQILIFCTAFKIINTASENMQRCDDMSKNTPGFCNKLASICPSTCGRNPVLDCGTKVPNKPTLKLKPKTDLKEDISEKETQTVVVQTGSKRIMGGKKSQKGEWPWQVVMRGDINKTHMTSCGGSIIASDVILSATHCIFPVVKPEKWTVHIAMHNQVKDEPFEEKVKVKKIIRHDEFRSPGRMSDIALFQLERRIDFKNYNKEPICLPDPANPIATGGQVCYISGWGRVSEKGPKSKVIKHTNVKIISREVCNQPENYGGSVDETEFCAGRTHGGKDACEGDSGGTLACRNGNRWFAEGVVSLGEGCGRSHKYGVYTNVSYFQDWIIKSFFNKLE